MADERNIERVAEWLYNSFALTRAVLWHSQTEAERNAWRENARIVAALAGED